MGKVVGEPSAGGLLSGMISGMAEQGIDNIDKDMEAKRAARLARIKKTGSGTDKPNQIDYFTKTSTDEDDIETNEEWGRYKHGPNKGKEFKMFSSADTDKYGPGIRNAFSKGFTPYELWVNRDKFPGMEGLDREMISTIKTMENITPGKRDPKSFKALKNKGFVTGSEAKDAYNEEAPAAVTAPVVEEPKQQAGDIVKKTSNSNRRGGGGTSTKDQVLVEEQRATNVNPRSGRAKGSRKVLVPKDIDNRPPETQGGLLSQR